jgi:hypothetical protein
MTKRTAFGYRVSCQRRLASSKGCVMKTEFIRYLDGLSAYTHGAALINASKMRVRLAEMGDAESLLQLFRDYPLEYHFDKTLVFAIPLTQKNRWQKILLNLLELAAAQLSYTETHLALTVKKLLADMLLNACVQLLDVDSRLKPEIMALFALEKLLNSRAQEKIIIYNIIYSYWMEIININLGVLAISADCNIQRLEALQKFLRSLLREQNNFTPFFMMQMQQFEEVFSTGHYAVYLADLPADKITGRFEIHSSLGLEMSDAR